MSLDVASDSQRRRLRDVLGHFATGVTVVTARSGKGVAVGLTVNSFTSVSLDPPLVLWCLGRRGAMAEAFRDVSHFAVNVLSADQEALARLFAERRDDKFEHVPGVSAGAGGAPLLPGCSAWLQCRTHATYDGGDHLILVGEVLAIDDRPQCDALLFHRGRFGRTSPADR